jgi:EF-P beta-lysylation protein EpmB
MFLQTHKQYTEHTINMIPRRTNPRHNHEWKKQQALAVSDPEVLRQLLGLDPTTVAGAQQAIKLFSLRVPHTYLARVKKGDLNDPLLKQILPSYEETFEVHGFLSDPVGELDSMPVPGLLHKYHGRVLLLVTGACAIHCRYCFRRHFPYGEAKLSGEHWFEVLKYLRSNPTIREVILSGGDPLTLTDQHLADLVTGLESIPHIATLRIHTRQPVVLPARVNDALTEWLAAVKLHKIMVIHSNHANELDHSVAMALKRLALADVTLFNQSVLLRGVNDDINALKCLSETLFEMGVQPYYLHLLDKVKGAAHFEVPLTRARALIKELTRKLPGYLVPRLVCEKAGAPAKCTLI